MQRTGHSSAAVRAYKQIGDKLKSLTSDVLHTTVSVATKEANGTVPTVKKEDDGATKGKENCTNVEKEKWSYWYDKQVHFFCRSIKFYGQDELYSTKVKFKW